MALPLILVFITLALGVLVFVKAPKNKTNIYFALLVAFLSAWSVCVYFEDVVSEDLALVFTKADLALGLISSIFFLLFSYNFPRRTLKTPAFIDYILIFAGLIVAYLSQTALVLRDVSRVEGGVILDYGTLYPLYLIILLSSLLLAIILLWARYIKSVGEEKKQVLFILIGLGVVAVVATVAVVILPKLIPSEPNISIISIYSLAVFIGFISYAIIKHHFLDIRLIATEIFTVALWVLLLLRLLPSTSGIYYGPFTNIVILLVAIGCGLMLIKSVQNEIRQRKQLEILTEEMKKANTKLAQADAMKTEFISLASHELLTPISAIEGYLSMMLDEKMVRLDDPKAVKYLTNVYISSKRLARLVSDLLNVSRIEQGRLAVQKTDLGVNQVIQSVVDELKFKARDASIVIQNITTPEHQKLMTYADADKIKEVLVNLCGNALKFTPRGGRVAVTAWLWPTEAVNHAHAQSPAGQSEQLLGQMPNGQGSNGGNGNGAALQQSVDERYKTLLGDNQIVVSVADNGMGITPDDMKKLFRKFSRLDSVMAHSIPGTGLGLYISKALVELNHGRIWAESPGKGKGTVFRFSLPATQVKDQIARLDAQVPKVKDAKPLSHMGEEKAGNK